jgi:glycosyltransferase involved in cell wall biosynthesis
MDGIPVALMEALAQGIPTISTKISGIPELIDATRGRLVPSEDSNALAAAMAEVIAMDAEQREAMCKNARTFVLRHFNSDTELEKLISIIDGTFVEAR